MSKLHLATAEPLTKTATDNLEPALAVISREFRVNPSQVAGVGDITLTTRQGQETFRTILCRPGSNDSLQVGDEKLTVAQVMRKIEYDPKGSPVYVLKYVDGEGTVHTLNSFVVVRTYGDKELKDMVVYDIHNASRKASQKPLFHADRRTGAKRAEVLVNSHIVGSLHGVPNTFWSGSNTSLGCDSERLERRQNSVNIRLTENPFESNEQAMDLIEFAQERFSEFDV